MTAKIYIPALGAIVILLSVIAGIMVHQHERREAVRAYWRQSNNQALAASCKVLAEHGDPITGCPKTDFKTKRAVQQ
jgi:hypothetical protein